MITIGMLAVLCGADGFVAIETYGKANQAWLERFLDQNFLLHILAASAAE
jgi:hypothetical protein